jgi:leucine-zipper of insertion element IS481
MKLHTNAQTCPRCRFLIVSRVMNGQTAASVARDFQITTKTTLKWVARFRAEGADGFTDKSSRPHRIVHQLLKPGKELNNAVFALLHAPPSDCGFNRTTWRLRDLHSALRARGC